MFSMARALAGDRLTSAEGRQMGESRKLAAILVADVVGRVGSQARTRTERCRASGGCAATL